MGQLPSELLSVRLKNPKDIMDPMYRLLVVAPMNPKMPRTLPGFDRPGKTWHTFWILWLGFKIWARMLSLHSSHLLAQCTVSAAMSHLAKPMKFAEPRERQRTSSQVCTIHAAPIHCTGICCPLPAPALLVLADKGSGCSAPTHFISHLLFATRSYRSPTLSCQPDFHIMFKGSKGRNSL